MKPNYGKILRRYTVAKATEEQHNAVIRLIRWMIDAETKEDFLLYVDAVDANEVFTIEFIKILVRVDPKDPIHKKAIKLNVLRRRV